MSAEVQAPSDPAAQSRYTPERYLPSSAPIVLSAEHSVDSPLPRLEIAIQPAPSATYSYVITKSTTAQSAESQKESEAIPRQPESQKQTLPRVEDVMEDPEGDLQQSYVTLRKVTTESVEVLRDLATRVRKLDEQNYEIVDVISRIKEEVEALKNGISKSTYYDHKQSLLSAASEVKGFEGNVPAEFRQSQLHAEEALLPEQKSGERADDLPLANGYRTAVPISALQREAAIGTGTENLQQAVPTTTRPMSSHNKREPSVISAVRSSSPPFAQPSMQASAVNGLAHEYASYQGATLPPPTVTSVRRSVEPRHYPLYAHGNGPAYTVRGADSLYGSVPNEISVPPQGFYSRMDYAAPLHQSYSCRHYCHPAAPVGTFSSYSNVPFSAPYHIHHNTSMVSTYSTLHRSASVPPKEPLADLSSRRVVAPEGVSPRQAPSESIPPPPSGVASTFRSQSATFPKREVVNAA